MSTTSVDSIREEIASALTHGLGAVLALAASAVLITLAAIYGDGWQLASAIVFGIATISNDNLQDLKTGQLVGATPWRQQVALVLGVLFGEYRPTLDTGPEYLSPGADEITQGAFTGQLKLDQLDSVLNRILKR